MLTAFSSLFRIQARNLFFHEAWKNERALSVFRAAIWLGVGGAYGFFELSRHGTLSFAPALALTWGTLIVLIGRLWLRKRYHEAAPFVFAGIDVIVFCIGRDLTHAQMLAAGNPMATHQLYGVPLGLMVIICMNALRFSWLCTAFTTVAACIGYVVVVGHHGGLDTLSAVDVAMLVAAGTLLMYATRRLRLLVPRALERDALARFLPAPAVDQIVKNPNALDLGGVELEATVLFSDIRGFTAMSSHMSPQDVVLMLNDYFREMVEEIFANRGVLDKFLGDGICAVFEPRIAGPQHAERAVRCAMGMLRRLREINTRRAAAGLSSLEIGVGLNTGKLLAGRIGSPLRMEYSHIGDTVNTASRVESCTKDLKVPLLLTDSTRQSIGDSPELTFIEQPPMSVKGKNAPLKLWTVTAVASHAFVSSKSGL